MVDVCHDRVTNVSDDELRGFVQSALIRQGKDPSCIRQITRTDYDYHSSFAIELLVAKFDDGSQLPLIFKNLSPHALLEEARRVRPSKYYRPEREILVYREILAFTDLGSADCHGSLIDHDSGRYWLLLEKVVGDELYTIGDFSIWCHVASWLARAHTHFDRFLTVRHSNALLQYDADYFCASIQGARARIEKRAASSAVERAQFRNLWRTCEKIRDWICELPPTLVHGDFYPSNILISAQDDQFRICAVDWELAGIGPGLLDLAALVSGKWSESQRQELARAYFHELAYSQVGDSRKLEKALLACRLLVAVAWLGWSPDWQPPVMHQQDWFQEALCISAQLQELG